MNSNTNSTSSTRSHYQQEEDLTKEEACCWEPLEGTPETLNALIHELLLPGGRCCRGCGTFAGHDDNNSDDEYNWHFVSVLGLDSELLAMLPSDRVVSLILLYPTTLHLEHYLRRNDDTMTDNNMNAVSSSTTTTTTTDGAITMPKIPKKNVVFLRQLVGGTCGTIAVVHALANCLMNHHNENITGGVFPEDSILAELWRDAMAANDDEENDENEHEIQIMRRSRHFVESKQVQAARQAALAAMRRPEGSSTNRASAAGIRQGRHFITFVHLHGMLVELDGRRPRPVGRRLTTGPTFLVDAAAEITTMLTTATVTDPSIHVRCSLVALVRPRSCPSCCVRPAT
jgi:ubiquitin carboxyl-terminal hydrolase L3